MMATEPSINNPTVVSASTEPRITLSASQHVDHNASDLRDAPVLNDDIANKRITSVEDQVNSADVSVSGGSDTEARQRDGDDKGHGRSGSYARKPATFKAVSVNKTFLASKANPTSGTTKAVDKPVAGSSTPPPGSATLSVRPRLIAKTGSGTRDSLPRLSSTTNGAKPALTPDPSVVWNKNRPVPPPEPQKFTDEELKKYGIHMASRLNEDDAQGQNKWADIDDDDDDWAPEAITWGDGTKTTLPHSDEPPVPASENGSVTSKDRSLPEKPRSPDQPSGQAGSPIVKTSGLASGRGLILKAASQEKPALVAKPPALPVPAKSPWATLPQIEKAPPVPTEPINPGHHQFPDASSTRGSIAPQPKEIAADDFSRSTWRDGASLGNRELYNSQSGRYEPVTDRRGSMRLDQQPKHPALLQRPHQVDHPAEPSSAFQTNRNAQEVPYGRRRGSSNASGGSGPFFQRMGKGSDSFILPPTDASGARRGSMAGSNEAPLSPGNISASIQSQPRHHPQQTQSWGTRPPSNTSFSATHQGAAHIPQNVEPSQPVVPAQPAEDEMEYQKKVMREKRELARKRREEEVAREEAERKERILKKLEALGPAPKKAEKKETPPKVEPAKPVQIQQREQTDSKELAALAENPDLQSKNAAFNKPVHSDVLSAASTAARVNNVAPPVAPTRRLSQGQEGKRPDPWIGSGPRPGPERYTPWAPGSQPQPRNVWGSPDNDRGLGNGTFDPAIGLLAGSTAVPGQSKGPSPIAPPNSVRVPAQGRQQPPAPIGSRAARYGVPGSDITTKWVATVADNDKKMSAARLAERAAQERQLSERGLTIEDVQPTIKDTWRPVQVPGDGTRRVMGTVEVQSHQSISWKTPREELGSTATPSDGPVPPTAAGVIGSGSNSILSQAGPTVSSQPRQSRFFPSRDARIDAGQAADFGRPTSPSPPPPTTEDHPAYEGDTMYPHVSLPRPQPVVKLPPSLMALQQSPPKPNAAWGPRGATRTGSSNQGHLRGRSGEVSTGNWQDKINNLLNGSKPSPPKSLGIDPASRSALDHATQLISATVSLPGPLQVTPQAHRLQGHGQRKSTTKPMAEECFEEQEMGSLPQIRFPRSAPEAVWQPFPEPVVPKGLQKKLSVHAAVMSPFILDTDGRENSVRIHFPGMVGSKHVALPASVSRGDRGSRSRGSPRHRGSSHSVRGGKREVSSGGGGEASTASKSGRPSRGGYKGRASDSWHRQAQPQSAQT